MVHQLLLVSTIPHSSYVQSISTLKALTGQLAPQEISLYTMITKPHHVFKPKFEPGKVNQIEQYYMRCVTTWEPSKRATKIDISEPVFPTDEIVVDKLFTNGHKNVWTLQIADIPIAGKNQVVSARTIYESTLVHHHTSVDGKDSMLQFLDDLGYDVINQYWINGVQFFYGDVVIEIFKLFIRDDEKEGIKLKPLDSSNSFQIRCYRNIPKSTDIEMISQGTKELLKLQEHLKNLFQLEVPDRMCMDSRVQNPV